ncbi:MAG: HemK/PrmC family methyltransferase, partial [Pseudomonadales bacterium]
MNIAQALERAALLVDSDSSQLDVQLLLCDALQCARSYLFTWPERELTGAQLERFDACFTRRLGGEPIAYILGYQDFWTLRLAVSPATLIPRPDTELLVEAALDLGAEQGLKVADLGTGTGAVALALASERPAWRIVACDIKPEACELAERNRIACAL